MAIIANRGSATQVIDLEKGTAIPDGLRVHLIVGGEFQHGAAWGGRALCLCSRLPMKSARKSFPFRSGLPVLIRHFP
jgi:hypothetical protein